MKIEPRDIDSLIEIFNASQWDEMQLKVGDVEIFLSTDPKARIGAGAVAPIAASASATTTASAAASPPTAHAAAPTASAAVAPAHWVAIKAPNLGTFYRAPKPGAPAFVELDAPVDVDTEICLIEVMKLFTTLKAGVKGVLKQVCVQDAVMVEHGDVLFYIEPN